MIPGQKNPDEAEQLGILRQAVMKELWELAGITEGLGTNDDDPPSVMMVMEYPRLSVQEVRIIDGIPELSRWDNSSAVRWLQLKTITPRSRTIITVAHLTREECEIYLQYFAAHNHMAA